MNKNEKFKVFCEEFTGHQVFRNDKEVFKFELFWNNISISDVVNSDDFELRKRILEDDN